ncbi:DUF6894 family protein [Methylobacterium oxalidis]|uniref:DUF6894 family protein n=1 Tax=Methylobacterium oxalidis TaxID=944322 RepID=UPI0033162D4D
MCFFYFHLRTAQGLERDEVGLTCPNLEAAYLDACSSIPMLMAELVDRGHDPSACSFEITDWADQFLMEVPFLERVRRQPKLHRTDVPVLSPETHALVNQLDLLTLAIQREAARLQENMSQARGHVARLSALRSQSGWCFETWSDGLARLAPAVTMEPPSA